ncbi:MAG: hypothetical protein WCR86_10450 [Parabacteroides sp.]
MLKKDFIMVQIEQLAKIVLQIVNHRDTNDTGRIPELIETVYSSLKIDHHQLMTSQPSQLVEQLNEDDLGGLLRLEIAAKTLIEESYLYPDKRYEMLLRAKALLEYIQTHDNTFSMERVSMIEEINNQI